MLPVLDVTKHVRDHPGGADVLLDVAGNDATVAYDEVGHSEDADELLKAYVVGTAKDAQEISRAKAVRLVQNVAENPRPTSSASVRFGTTTVTVGSITAALSLLIASQGRLGLPDVLSRFGPLSQLQSRWISTVHIPQGGFSNGFIAATFFCAAIGGMIGLRLSNLTQIESGFEKYPPHIKSRPLAKANPHLSKGFLEPKEYKSLRLIKKEVLSPNVYLFVFQLPGPQDVIGLPIGQHVAIKANVGGSDISRSYTPTSNNTDIGRLELVIKCYPDGALTGKYLQHLQLGDSVLFRGPKGAMKYTKGLCKEIGMIAGGTGITPMYQLIRAICEDDSDTTQISLMYANRTEEDILLRKELEAFAGNYPKNLKIWYMLEQPPPKWAYGKGYVTKELMASKLPKPSPDTKVMICGPPGMVNASKKSLIALGFEAPGAVSKMTDQIFCF
ncbi:cytochrome b5 reductase, putative [Metarhizium acridum CQMa 102]|uniref:Cytochrome b5 reductase, putative n=1 Tax=Metarhizium acridum (strain CQMa 102) TaxID=655827 RepID=E9E515_METAQ|nr:cytochrome b5 reductase, putative [Metarhizium acridum CQMa 102]EFY89032.1 cytochrome b5 reductase, putative [Metarhizium acridum CQMa 102]